MFIIKIFLLILSIRYIFYSIICYHVFFFYMFSYVIIYNITHILISNDIRDIVSNVDYFLLILQLILISLILIICFYNIIFYMIFIKCWFFFLKVISLSHVY